MRLPRLAATVLLAVAMSAACASTPTASTGAQQQAPAVTTTTTAAAPKTVDAAKAVAAEEAATYSAGDWAGAWDLWSAAGKKAISRTDYVRLHTECKTLTGVPLTVDNVRLEGDSAAVVRMSRMGFSLSYTEVYEGGQWRWQPNPDDMADYALGIDALIAKKKNAGSCM